MRKLAAIMFTDIVGFTSIMGESESKAMELVKEHRRILQQLVPLYEGEWLKEMGDGSLSCFDSSVEAVNCAVAIQKELADHPDLKLRIGIHIGDVIMEDDDVFGEGVNVASRIEPLAEPGGICISERVHSELRNKEEIDSRNLGEVSLKHVEQPIQAYALVSEGLPEPESRPVEADNKLKGTDAQSFQLLIGLILLILAATGGWYFYTSQFSSDMATTTQTKESAVAVLPFEVSGSGAEEWRDGMVTLLSTGLDGMVDVRAIPDRTVFARWKKKAKTDGTVSQEKALKIATNLGARYGVIGSAVGLGDKIQFIAEVHNTQLNKKLGEVRIKGTSNNINQLANQLTRKVAQILLQEKGKTLESINLKSVTTSSVPALKAFFNGEKSFRQGEYEAAIKDFERAIQKDSTFALAYFRKALSQDYHEWHDPFNEEEQVATWNRAFKYSSRLPARESRLIQAIHLYEVKKQPSAAVDSLRRLAEDYPKDPNVWFMLGEVLTHSILPISPLAPDYAFKKAVNLDPGVQAYYYHLNPFTLFRVYNDSNRIHRKLRTYPDKIWDKYSGTISITNKLLFGSTEQRERVLSSIDTLTGSKDLYLMYSLAHPSNRVLQERVIRKFRSEKKKALRLTENMSLIDNYFSQGKVRKALELLKSAQIMPLPYLYEKLSRPLILGLPLPASSFQDSLKPDRLDKNDPSEKFLCAGLYLINENRENELNAIFKILRKKDYNRKESLSGLPPDDVILLLRLYRRWQDNELRDPLESLSGLTEPTKWAMGDGRGIFPSFNYRIGEVYRSMGKLKKAEDWYVSAWIYPLVHQRLGMIYEKMNKPEKAAAAYRRFIKAWKNADSELQPRVQQARDRLEQLIKSKEVIER